MNKEVGKMIRAIYAFIQKREAYNNENWVVEREDDSIKISSNCDDNIITISASKSVIVLRDNSGERAEIHCCVANSRYSGMFEIQACESNSFEKIFIYLSELIKILKNFDKEACNV